MNGYKKSGRNECSLRPDFYLSNVSLIAALG